jgi:hypothetical protein
MRRRSSRRATLEELVEMNKVYIMSDKNALDAIDRKIEDKYSRKVSNINYWGKNR